MTNSTPLTRAYGGRTDARTDADAGGCPVDTSKLREQLGQVEKDIEAGRVVRILKERTRHGLAWVIVVETATEKLTERAVRWMIENDQLNRRAFFEACPWASSSVSLADRAVKRIAKAGLSEKIGGAWVLKDHDKALAWLRGQQPRK